MLRGVEAPPRSLREIGLLKQLEEDKTLELLKLQFMLALEAKSEQNLKEILENVQYSLLPEGLEKAKKAEQEQHNKVADDLQKLNMLFAGDLDEF